MEELTMNDDNIVDIEPKIQRRINARNKPTGQLNKTELQDIAASETLVLATAMAQVVLDGLDMKERRKFRRLLLLIACGLAVSLVGVARLAIILMHHQ